MVMCVQTPQHLTMSLAGWQDSYSCDITIDVVSCLQISSDPSSHSNIIVTRDHLL